MSKIIFLDRDGVINKKAPEHEHILSIENFIILPRVKEAIDICVQNGYKVIVITNQRNVPKFTYDLIHTYMKEQLPGIDAVYVCPHEEGTCTCRKPLPGLFYYAEQDFNVDKSSSWMIGDSISDIVAGESYGINTKLTQNLYETVKEIMQCEY